MRQRNIIRVDGLSPRMRGNLVATGMRWRRRGSIPAYAGEPEVGAGTRQREMVYPRVCGGTRWLAKARAMGVGLSPRMRGNQSAVSDPLRPQGSIPAYAGEPTQLSSVPAVAKVYPRVCGGTGYQLPPPNAVGGLSPRMRGNPLQRTSRTHPFWSIPAYAGEP